MSVTSGRPVRPQGHTSWTDRDDAETPALVESATSEARRILVLFNPISGSDERRDTIRQALEAWKDGGDAEVDILETESGEDVRRRGRQAAERGYELILVVGGDGTLRLVADGAAEADDRPPIALIPAGTGNAVAGALGLPENPEEALALLDGAHRFVQLDLGWIEGTNEHFLLAAGAGFPARMISDTSREAKNRLGFFAYILSGTLNFFRDRSRWIHLVCDDTERFIRAKSVFVINVRLPWLSWLDERFLETPIDPTDGLFDVLVPETPSVFSVLKSLLLRLLGRTSASPKLHHFRAQRVEVSTEPPLATQVDGDTLDRTPLVIEAISGRCMLLAPEEESSLR